MNILNLADDILGMVGDEVKNQPKYKFKKVLEELKEKDIELNSVDLWWLVEAEPFIYASWYNIDEGGWWFDDILGEECGSNWITQSKLSISSSVST
tara:strand:+ start:16 stop:303 length:288 start_codon:yes stop_codon:yes gene_type:complete